VESLFQEKADSLSEEKMELEKMKMWFHRGMMERCVHGRIALHP